MEKARQYNVYIIDDHDYPIHLIGTFDNVNDATARASEAEECGMGYRTIIRRAQ